MSGRLVSNTPPSHVFRRFGVVLTVALVVAALASASTPVRAQDTEPVKVLATFSILADWVQNVGGENIELTTIVPAGGDAHTFDPSPEQVASIADADLIFEIGIGFESWLDDMYDASGSTAERVVVSEGVVLAAGEDSHEGEASGEHEGDDHAGEGDEHEGEDHAPESASPEADAHADEGDEHANEGVEHGHGENDPHIWGDVTNAMSAVDVINTHLNEVDPDNAADYDANTAAYVTELEELDAYVQEATGSIPEDLRKLVTTHDTFGYYANAYDFVVVGTALNSLSTEGGDPPASEIAALVSEIQEQEVPAIFAENVSNNDLMQTIADEAGVTLAPP
ncbi:MAG: zinc ABC transporter substrate-binding protein, partial [Chloroflexota bacterium]|nr:zinc ABC transporter substrate-binding protein [Chloroflexota bacterium]